MPGKAKCKILKEIRRRIAEENDIPYVTHECGFQGACRGICPRCESELRYLEQQLALRASLGKRVAVAALCAGMTLTATGCAPLPLKGLEKLEAQLSGDVAVELPVPTPTPQIEVTTGEIYFPEDDVITPPPAEESPVPYITDLTGDVAYPFPNDHG